MALSVDQKSAMVAREPKAPTKPPRPATVDAEGKPVPRGYKAEDGTVHQLSHLVMDNGSSHASANSCVVATSLPGRISWPR